MLAENTTEVKINPKYQDLVFPLPDKEYQELKKSIQENGLWHSITVNKEGYVLDGHHRLKIAQELQIQVTTTIIELGNEQEEKLFVIDSNLKRRHLNTFQRVELALKKKPIYEEISRTKQRLGGQNKVSQKSYEPLRVDQMIANDANTSKDTVRKVEVILEKADADDLARVRAGKRKIHQVSNHIKKAEIRAELIRSARERDFNSVLYQERILKSNRPSPVYDNERPKVDRTIFEEKSCTKGALIEFLSSLDDTAILSNVYLEVEGEVK